MAGATLPTADSNRPPKRDWRYYEPACTASGKFGPGQPSAGQDTEDLTVSGRLWWSGSNWRNHISVPLAFDPEGAVCSVTSGKKPIYFFGSYLANQVTGQWAPKFCNDTSLTPLRHVEISEPQAKNLLDVRSVEGALQALPPDTPFSYPVVQAPVALTGYGIVFVIDHRDGSKWTTLRLNPRLIAKLLTHSYPGQPAIAGDYPALVRNANDIGRDPEFQALNPDLLPESYSGTVASTLYMLNKPTDATFALTQWINSDKEARDWLNGYPDPWGMVVNPTYRNMVLPVTQWPELDGFIPPSVQAQNSCLADNPVPWFIQVSGATDQSNRVTLNMQFGISNSKTVCKDAGSPVENLVSIGRMPPGQRLILGLIPLADAARYQIDVAELQTSSKFVPGQRFTDATGRTFASATTQSLTNAATLMKPNVGLGTWELKFADVAASTKPAYPGTMLVSADVPTSGLSSGDANAYKSFLDYAVGPGQTPGTSFGTLPEGYVPLSDKPLSSFKAYTLRAAAAVQAQKGFVPGVDGSGTPPSPSPSATPSASAPASPSPTPIATPVYTSQPPPLDVTPSPLPSTGSQTPTPPSSPAPTITPQSSESPVQVAHTVPVQASAGAAFIPALLLLSLLSALSAAIVGRKS